MHNESVDDYVLDSTNLVTNFQRLIKRNFSLLKNKEEELNQVDLYINFFSHHLTVHQIHINIFYPLKNNYENLKTVNPNLDEKKANALIQIIDLNAKSSFVSMCGFQLENILKQIAKAHDIKMNNNNMRTKFQSVLEYFEISSEDKLNLIDVFYWTRNTLHDGSIVDRPNETSYQGHIYRFEVGKGIEHATWDYFTYFVNEIIGLIEEILNSKKYRI